MRMTAQLSYFLSLRRRSVRAAVRACARPCVRPYVIHVVVLFPRYLQYLLTDFRQTFGHRWPDYVFGSKGLCSRSHHRGGGAQHSTLPSSATFSSRSLVFCHYNLNFFFGCKRWPVLLGLCLVWQPVSVIWYIYIYIILVFLVWRININLLLPSQRPYGPWIQSINGWTEL